MAFDALESQIDQLTVTELTAGPAVEASVQSSNQTLARLSIAHFNGQTISAGHRLEQNSTSIQIRAQGLNSQGQTLNSTPRIRWIVGSSDRKARATINISNDIASITFNRLADYQIVLQSGRVSTRFNVRVSAPATSLAVLNGSSRSRIVDNGQISLSGTSHLFTVVGLSATRATTALTEATVWAVDSSPEGSSPTFQTQGNRTTVKFDRAGQYAFLVSNGSLTSRVRVQVHATLKSLVVQSPAGSLSTGEAVQMQAVGLDQFQQAMEKQPTLTWKATGGKISSSGVFQAGAKPGNYRVTVQSGRLSAQAAITVNAFSPDNSGSNATFVGINDIGLRGLMQTVYADGSIDRAEMIQLLRSAGADKVVTATELADLRFIVSANSPYNMPAHVRGLTQNIVHDNPANVKVRNRAAGNLTAGSSGALLNQLVDKWFLGVDHPSLTSSSISYRYAVGTLFNGSPLLADSRQGTLGDCYFLASLVSIAQINPTAIENMFTDNGDGTYTVRFFAGSLGMFWKDSLISGGFVSGNGVADYVTVDRNLPSLSNGSLAYSGYGRSALSSSTPLWLALAEKAYAQWNETGRAGRNGTNSYAGIEGGWMSDVNAQVLGFNSTIYAVNSNSKKAMIGALDAGQAVTMGTNPNASTGGLVGSHAYVVTGYNSANDTFTFYNTWSTQHPIPLTWSQMQGQISAFVIANTTGSLRLLSSGAVSVRSSSLGSAAPASHGVPKVGVAPSPEQIDELLASLLSEEDLSSTFTPGTSITSGGQRDSHPKESHFATWVPSIHAFDVETLEASEALLEELVVSPLNG